ncbi:uncharacterized protein BDV14DRAFT_78339 [Aspergillus stella-maris]|uniref:uncharacterized protein n=1 Tax=Aspergillus stella-maris TaxID=1810926 RepID=UPI003CCCB074
MIQVPEIQRHCWQYTPLWTEQDEKLKLACTRLSIMMCKVLPRRGQIRTVGR